MTFNPKSLENVKCRWAKDTTGPTILSTFRIEKDMIAWLKTLEGGSGLHVRNALKDYKRKLEDAGEN